MGIKMDHAFDQNDVRWEAATYSKGMGAEPLKCKCGTPVVHNPPYPKEMYDKPVFVQGYFRRIPKALTLLTVDSAWMRKSQKSLRLLKT